MEYYTKSEGLGFLIGESRIDFRIEFRGVSILCEFNSSTRYGFRRTIIRRSSTYLGLSRPTWSLMATTKRCYGRNRTHQRPLVSHDQRGLSWPPPEYVMVTLEPINVPWSLTTSMVSHDHHQTVRYGEEAGVSTADSTFSNSNGHKWPHDGATDNLALSGWRWLKQYDCQNFTDGQAAKSDTPDTKIRSNEQRGVLNQPQVTEDTSWVLYSTVKKTQHSIVSRNLVVLRDHRWLSSRSHMTCKLFWSHMTIQNCSGQSLVPISKWFDTAEMVSTMIRQSSKRTFLQNLHNFNPSFRFLPCRT